MAWSLFRAERELLTLVYTAKGMYKQPVVLTSNYATEVHVKELLAKNDKGFGVQVCTFNAWIQDLWELFGDGRTIINAPLRNLIMQQILGCYLHENPQSQLHNSPGYLKLLCDIASEAFWDLSIQSSSAKEKGIGEIGLEILQGVLPEYGKVLEARNQIEPTEVYAYLREKVFPAHKDYFTKVELIPYCLQPTVAQDRLLDVFKDRRIIIKRRVDTLQSRPEELMRLQKTLYEPDFDNPVQPEGFVHFLLPEGRYAEPSLIANYLKTCTSGKTAAVFTAHPTEMFDELAGRLQEAGVTVSLETKLSYEQTSFGRAWLNLLEFIAAKDTKADFSQATDFAYSPFSTMSIEDAQHCDTLTRSWRGKTRNDVLTDLAGFANDDYTDIVTSAIDGNYQEALDSLKQFISKNKGFTEAFRVQNLAVLEDTKTLHAMAEITGSTIQELLTCLRTRSVMHRVQVGGKSKGQTTAGIESVVVRSLNDARSLPETSVDVALVCNLTAEEFPLKEDRSAKDNLLERFGLKPAPHDVDDMRDAFAAALATARQQVVIERCTHTVDADEAVPSALFEELTDCYRSDPQNPEELDKRTLLPKGLLPYVQTRGEDAVSRDMYRVSVPPSDGQEFAVQPAGCISEASRPLILLPRMFNKETVLEEPYLSPSAIESYLECPYLWFARRRLRLDTPDADFGGLAFGNFAHLVLQKFHDALIAGVCGPAGRVTQKNIGESISTFNRIFNELLEKEQERKDKTALIILNEIDKLEVENLRRKIEDFIYREAHFAPEYVPWKTEAGFGEEDGPFEYAGVFVNGKIDRIDVDGFGYALVIDYKGRVNNDYALCLEGGLEDETFVLPRKIQALIYAQVVRKKFGLIPTAALYLSYGKDKGISGAYNQTVFHADRDLLGIRAKSCGVTHFEDMLDRTEELIAERIQHLLAGEIPTNPRDIHACRYCPVTLCPGRDALQLGRG